MLVKKTRDDGTGTVYYTLSGTQEELNALSEFKLDDPNITEFEFPSWVKNIPNNLLCGIKQITKIILNEGLKSIGYKAFAGTGITSIIIPASVTKIGPSTFAWCRNLSEVTLNEGLQSIGEEAFSGAGITSIIIPASVTTIGNDAFAWCGNLRAVTLNDGLKSIGNEAFSGTGITSIIIPASVTKIGPRTFALCSNLSEVTLNDGLKSIRKEAFYITGITSIIIPSTVTTIGNSAFIECESLRYIIVANGNADKIKKMLRDNQKKLVIEEKHYNKAFSIMIIIASQNPDFNEKFRNCKTSLIVNLVLQKIDQKLPQDMIDEISLLAADRGEFSAHPLMQLLQSFAIPRIDNEDEWDRYKESLNEISQNFKGYNQNTAVSSGSLARPAAAAAAQQAGAEGSQQAGAEEQNPRSNK